MASNSIHIQTYFITLYVQYIPLYYYVYISNYNLDITRQFNNFHLAILAPVSLDLQQICFRCRKLRYPALLGHVYKYDLFKHVKWVACFVPMVEHVWLKYLY